MDATCLCACDSLDTELCCSQECPGDQLQSWIGQNFFSKVHRFMISHSLVPNCRDDSQAHKAQHCRVELQRPKLYCSPAFRWRPARSMAASLTNKYWLLGQQEWFTNDSAGYRPHHLQSHVSFAVRSATAQIMLSTPVHWGIRTSSSASPANHAYQQSNNASHNHELQLC